MRETEKRLFNPVSIESHIMLNYVRSGKHSKCATVMNDQTDFEIISWSCETLVVMNVWC